MTRVDEEPLLENIVRLELREFPDDRGLARLVRADEDPRAISSDRSWSARRAPASAGRRGTRPLRRTFSSWRSPDRRRGIRRSNRSRISSSDRRWRVAAQTLCNYAGTAHIIAMFLAVRLPSATRPWEVRSRSLRLGRCSGTIRITGCESSAASPSKGVERANASLNAAPTN